MSVTMIRGYGLPGDAAGVYNGYGAAPTGSAVRAAAINVPSVVLPRTAIAPPASLPDALFRTMPDPELSHYGGYSGGFGLTMTRPTLTANFTAAAATNTDPGATGPTGGGVGGGFDLGGMLPLLALGAVGVGLFMLFKKGGD